MVEEKDQKPYVRRKYYVKNFQLKFVTRFCGLLIIGAIVMGGLIYLFSQSTVTTAFENSRLLIKSTADYMLPTLIMSTLVMLVIVCLVSLFFIIMFSHRIAGPIFRLEKYFDSLKEGYISDRVFLRSTDEIQELAGKCNDMAKEYCLRIEEMKKENMKFGRLEDSFKELVAKSEKELDAQELSKLLLEFSGIREKLDTELEFFKTT